MQIYFLVKQEVIPVVFNGIWDKYDKISLSNLTHFMILHGIMGDICKIIIFMANYKTLYDSCLTDLLWLIFLKACSRQFMRRKLQLFHYWNEKYVNTLLTKNLHFAHKCKCLCTELYI